MILLMDFKSLTFNLYFTFLKFAARNQLQFGLKKDDTDCRKEGKTIMNIFQFTHASQANIYN